MKINPKYIGVAIVLALSTTAGYMIVSEPRSKEIITDVSPSQTSIFTSETEMVGEFYMNAYTASRRYKEGNPIIRLNGIVGHINQKGAFLLARHSNNQQYEIGVVPNSTDIVSNLSVGSSIVVIGSFREVDGNLLVIDCSKIVKY